MIVSNATIWSITYFWLLRRHLWSSYFIVQATGVEPSKTLLEQKWLPEINSLAYWGKELITAVFLSWGRPLSGKGRGCMVEFCSLLFLLGFIGFKHRDRTRESNLFSSLEHVKSLLIMGPTTQKLIIKVWFSHN